MTYATREAMDAAHQEELNAFPIVYAFNIDQFKEGIKRKWGLDYSNTREVKNAHIVSLGCGGYVLKKDVPALKEMLAKHRAEEKAFASDFKNLVDIIKAEMFNHEYTYVPYEVEEEVREALENVKDHPRFDEAWKKAKHEVLKKAGFDFVEN